MGQTGVAETDLRPSGAVRIGDKVLDVVTDGRFIETGGTVRVTQHNGNHIVVCPEESEA